MRLLDLYSGAGGAAYGYMLAGFHVTGVDHTPQPRYRGDAFVLGDAFEYVTAHGQEFDVIHASPPCQAWSRATAWRGDRHRHPRLIAATQQALRFLAIPYIIENVQEARHALYQPLMLCGSQFGLPVRSHRYFEIWPPLFALVPPCWHRAEDASRDHGGKQTEAAFRAAMGCDWMTVHEAREAIPPAYTHWLGTQLLRHLTREETP